MKKISRLFVLCVALTGMTIFGCSKKAQTGGTSTAENTPQEKVSKKLAQLRKKGVMIVGSSGDVYAYIDQKTGAFSGVYADIVIETARRLGIPKVEMALIPFSELILNCNNGTIDLIADGMYNSTPDRAKKVYFSDSIYWQGGVENWAKKGIIGEAVATGHQTDSIVALQFGKIDGFLTDSTVIEDLMTNAPDQVKGLRLAKGYVDDEIPPGHISFAANHEDADFIKELNAVFADLRAEGFIEKVFIKYDFDPALHCYGADADYEKDIKCPVNVID